MTILARYATASGEVVALMPVPMMRVGVVGVRVRHGLVPVPMTVLR